MGYLLGIDFTSHRVDEIKQDYLDFVLMVKRMRQMQKSTEDSVFRTYDLYVQERLVDDKILHLFMPSRHGQEDGLFANLKGINYENDS